MKDTRLQELAGKAVKGSVRSAQKYNAKVKHIYRAVSPEEYDDIFAIRGFRARADGKSFQTNGQGGI